MRDLAPAPFCTVAYPRATRRIARSVGAQRVYIAYFVALVCAGPLPAAWLVARGQVTRLDVALFTVFYGIHVFGWALGWHRMLAHRAFELHPVAKGRSARRRPWQAKAPRRPSSSAIGCIMHTPIRLGFSAEHARGGFV